MFAFLMAHGSDILMILGLVATLISAVAGLMPGSAFAKGWAKVLPYLSFLQPRDAQGTLKLPFTQPGETVGSASAPLLRERADEDASGVRSIQRLDE